MDWEKVRFLIIEEIAQSSCGKVCIAKKADTLQLAVVKIALNQKDRASLALEQTAYNLLSPIHPNILQPLEYNDEEQVCYLATELAKAKNLIEYLQTCQFYDKDIIHREKWVRFFIRQIIEGLSYIHAKGMTHRDMKVDNILLDYTTEGEGTLKALICDFGMAKFTDEQTKPVYGQRYGPPEKFPGALHPFSGAKADVFACAFILLALLTRKMLSSGEQALSKSYGYFLQYKGKASIVWEKLLGIVPTAGLQDLFDKMIEYNSEARIGIEEIKEHPWYVSDELPTAEKVKAEVERIHGYIYSNVITPWMHRTAFPEQRHIKGTHVTTFPMGLGGAAERGVFDDDTEFVSFETEDYHQLASALLSEDRSILPYTRAQFVWTQFPLPDHLQPHEILARLLTIQQHMSDIEGIDLFSVKLSPENKLSAMVQQLEPLPQPVVFQLSELLDTPTETAIQQRKLLEGSEEKVKDFPTIDVRVMKSEEDGQIIVQLKRLKGDIFEFQTLYKKIFRLLRLNQG
ncbi:hypothetical protein FGO68_gene15454 [Halteria grandinella]|uniref:non-specific serine/threonine protein kinase n=1 Tax=Halteria grandinella TaxID=5974 RepID=A0A8J8NSE3_HALGN|nr:hypothetical protein FGO68_gene15454 [Halteria grandinella]